LKFVVSLFTLPTSANRQSCVESVTIVQWPIVNNFRVILAGNHRTSVDVELHFGELHGHGVVMPLAIANLIERTSPYYIYIYELG
jgi:hypothetical protein